MECLTSMIKRVDAGARVVDGAGVRINRIIGTNRLDHIDPFVLLDEIRSFDPDDYVAGFPTHPHRGIETITYMKRGTFRHRDSRGNGGVLTDGCVQWMTAGRGILHSEMPEKTDGEFWGYQLWLSLPSSQKMAEPRYQHISPGMVPTLESKGISVKVISGKWGGATGPARNIVDAVYLDVAMAPGAVFSADMPAGGSGFIYVHTGSATVCPVEAGLPVPERRVAELSGPCTVELKASAKGAGLLFLQSRPNNEPIVRRGPFVMNSEEEIKKAFDDYRNGTLG